MGVPDIQVASAVHRDATWIEKPRRAVRAIGTAIISRTARNGGDHPIGSHRTHFPNRVITGVRLVHVARTVHRNTLW